MSAFKPVFIEIPPVNGHRFVLDSFDLPNFDNRLFKDMKIPGVIPCNWFQPVTRDQVLTTQFRSSYDNNELSIYDIDNNLVATFNPTKKTNYTGFAVRLENVFFVPNGDEGQLFFNDGLPEFAVEGQAITLEAFTEQDGFSINGAHEIKSIRPGVGDAEGFEVMIIDLGVIMTNNQTGVLSANYNIEPYDVFEQQINWGLYDNGRYYLVLEGFDDGFPPYRAVSEPIQLAASFRDSVLIKYKNFENSNGVNYDTGIVHELVVECELKHPTLGGERTVMEDSRKRLVKLAENVTRNPQFNVYNVPPYFAEKIALAFSSDWFTINDVEYQTEEDIEPTYFDGDPFCNLQAIVRQVVFNIDNSDDSGDVDTAPNVLGLNNELLEINP